VEIVVADSFWKRLVGLAWRPRPPGGKALLIPRCSSVHTIGMRYAIDVAFLGERNEVLAIERGVAPRRVLSMRAARSVLEAPEGGLERALRLLRRVPEA
jgi:uncharacterized membrane protein (UPF0127 family)